MNKTKKAKIKKNINFNLFPYINNIEKYKNIIREDKSYEIIMSGNQYVYLDTNYGRLLFCKNDIIEIENDKETKEKYYIINPNINLNKKIYININKKELKNLIKKKEKLKHIKYINDLCLCKTKNNIEYLIDKKDLIEIKN